jgi:hypothetical protein
MVVAEAIGRRVADGCTEEGGVNGSIAILPPAGFEMIPAAPTLDLESIPAVPSPYPDGISIEPLDLWSSR